MAQYAQLERARRRQSVFGGLRSCLSAEQTEQAMQIWDRSYQGARSSAIIEFVVEVAARLDLPPRKRHEIRLAVYQTLLAHGKTVGTPPVGDVQPASAARGTLVAAVSVPPTYIVFAAVLDALLDDARAAGAAQFDEFCARVSSSLRLGEIGDARAAALINWLRGRGRLQVFVEDAESVLAASLHLLYVALAEAVGPVLADRILARAITLGENLPEARQFAARRLL